MIEGQMIFAVIPFFHRQRPFITHIRTLDKGFIAVEVFVTVGDVIIAGCQCDQRGREAQDRVGVQHDLTDTDGALHRDDADDQIGHPGCQLRQKGDTVDLAVVCAPGEIKPGAYQRLIKEFHQEILHLI